MVSSTKRTRRRPSSRTARALLAGLLVLGCALTGSFAHAPLARASAGPQLDATRLSGLTRDALGRILADVEILLAPVEGERVGETLARVRSDAAGRFRVPGLEPGVYRVVAVKGGYGVVVGQVNTMLQASLDLILFPTGRDAADPSSTPADASWALRLPERDTLEDVEISHAGTLAGGVSRKEQAPARPPLHLSFLHQDLDAGSDAGSGVQGLDLDLDGALPLDDAGTLHLDVGYARLGRSAGVREEGTRVALGWIAPAGLGVDTRVDLFGARREQGRDFGGNEALFARVDRYALRAEQMRARPGGSLLLDLSLDELDAEQRLAGVADEVATDAARQVALSAELGREWSARHASRLRLTGAYGEGALVDGGEGRVLLVPASDAWSLAALDRVEGGSVSLLLEDRHTLTSALSAYLRAAAHALPGAGGGTRGASTAGVAWQPRPGTLLRAELGADWSGGRADASELWRIEIEHADDNWNLRVARARQTGAAPWIEAEPLLEQPLVVTDHAGSVESWSLTTSLVPDGAWWPTLELRGELYSLGGRLATRLEGDSPFVPVAEQGRAEGSRVALGVTLARLGTLIEMSWEGVEDEGGARELLGGASRFVRRGVSVRQRLGMIEWYGANCYLLVAVVDQDVKLAPESGAPDAGRLALLDQRRVSGGLAVAF